MSSKAWGIVGMGVLGLFACSSGSSSGGATGGATASGGKGGGTGGSAAHAGTGTGAGAGVGGAVGGSGGSSGATDGGPTGGSAGTGGSGGTTPLPTDVKDSAACKSWCAALDAACGKPTCDPAMDCAIPAGQCAESTEAYLECQATTGSFSCGADGHTIIHSCQKDSSVCPAGTIAGMSCDGHCGAQAPGGCYCDNECKANGDCCADYDAKCASGSGGSGGGSGGGTGAPATCAEANNGKGCCGWGSSPYDQIAYKCTGGKVVAEQCGVLGCVVDANGYAACGDGTEYPSLPNCGSN